MEHISRNLPQLNASTNTIETREPANEDRAAVSWTLTRDHVREIWSFMAGMFGHGWTSQYGTYDKNDAWRVVLQGVYPENVKVGLRAVAESGEDWPPSAPEFRRMCFSLKREAAHAPITRALPEPEADRIARAKRFRDFVDNQIALGLLPERLRPKDPQ